MNILRTNLLKLIKNLKTYRKIKKKLIKNPIFDQTISELKRTIAEKDATINHLVQKVNKMKATINTDEKNIAIEKRNENYQYICRAYILEKRRLGFLVIIVNQNSRQDV